MINKLKKIGFTVIIIGMVLNISNLDFPFLQAYAAEGEETRVEESEDSSETDTAITVIEIDQSFTLMPLDEDRELPWGFTETRVEIQGKDTPAWIGDGGENEFYLLYASNEAGERNFYQYDSAQGTLQRYFDHGLVIEERFFEAEEMQEPESITTVLLGDFSALLTVGILSFMVLVLGAVLTSMVIKRKRSQNPH